MRYHIQRDLAEISLKADQHVYPTSIVDRFDVPNTSMLPASTNAEDNISLLDCPTTA